VATMVARIHRESRIHLANGIRGVNGAHVIN
jgi:hypothetical protein